MKNYIINTILRVFIIATVATLTVRTYFPFPVVIFGLIVVFFLLYNWTLAKNDLFGFVIAILLLSFFQYGGAQGGLFNIFAFGLLVYHRSKQKSIAELPQNNNSVIFFGYALLFSNFLGYLFKPMGFSIDLIFGILSFLGYVLIFNLTSKLIITRERFHIIIKVLFAITVYSALVSINKMFNLLYFPIPLFGGASRWGSDNIGGLLGASPISGEWGLLFSILVTPLLLSFNAQKIFGFKSSFLTILLIVGILTVLLAVSRSTIVLLIFYFLFFFLFTSFKFGKMFNKSLTSITVIPLLFFTFISLSPILNLDTVERRFNQLETDQITLETIRTGEGINRGVAFGIGFEMIERENWMIGYGWGDPEHNRFAWFGTSDFYRSDPHSLYFSLPMLFGWIGGAAFLLLMLSLIVKLLAVTNKSSKTNHYLFFPAISFMFLIIFLMINQYKATFLGYNHYTMIIVILLGFANSIINSWNRNELVQRG
jgi:O-antigen ligase